MSYCGTCNGCGLCCQSIINIRTKTGTTVPVVANCENLKIKGIPGHEGATYCGVYERRYPGLPVKLLHLGQVVGETRCLPHYPRTQDAVPLQCSYEWKGPNKPRWFWGYSPKFEDEGHLE